MGGSFEGVAFMINHDLKKLKRAVQGIQR